MERRIVELFYFEQRFTININLFNRYSNYFLHNKNLEKEQIYLNREFDPNLQHSEKMINAFIKFFEKGEIDITNRNAFSIQFLSRKLDIPRLKELSRDYIEKKENEQELLDYIFSHTESLCSEQEEFIADDDRLLRFTISQLYRIICKYLKKRVIPNI